jgi:hypothetical protein
LSVERPVSRSTGKTASTAAFISKARLRAPTRPGHPQCKWSYKMKCTRAVNMGDTFAKEARVVCSRT